MCPMWLRQGRDVLGAEVTYPSWAGSQVLRQLCLDHCKEWVYAEDLEAGRTLSCPQAGAEKDPSCDTDQFWGPRGPAFGPRLRVLWLEVPPPHKGQRPWKARGPVGHWWAGTWAYPPVG